MRHNSDEKIPTLHVALFENMTVDDLKRLAKLTGAKVPTKKADLVGLIVRHLEGDRLLNVWNELNNLQRAAVAEVAHSDTSRFQPDRFYAKYGKNPDWGTIDNYGYIKQPSSLCLFFYKGIMPDDLKKRLRVLVPPPLEDQLKTFKEIPSVFERPYNRWNPKTKSYEAGTEPIPIAVRGSERAAQIELLSVLRLVDAGKVAVSDKTRKPSASAIGAITAVLEGGDFYPAEPQESKWRDENAGPIRAFAWPMLIQAGGLVELSGPRLQLTKSGRKALSAHPADTISSLWKKWTTTTIIDELSRIDCVKGQTGKGRRELTAVGGRRKVIASSLVRCPEGHWISVDEFSRFMQGSGNELTVMRGGWNLYVGEPRYGSLGNQPGEPILEKRYLLCLLLEYAATLGLIDAAIVPPAGARSDYDRLWGTDDLPYFSRYDGLLFFRITPLGAYCLGMSGLSSPAPMKAKQVLQVLPSQEITIMGKVLDPGDRLALDAYAVKASDFVWQLQTEKLLTAVEEGHSIREIWEFLEARSGAPLPETVQHLLHDASERCSKVHDRGLARLFKCADATLTDMIARDSRTRKHCMRVDDRHLVVPASSETAFRRALRDLGYLVAVVAE